MSLNLAVLTIGDELLNGEMADSNTMAIARLLSGHGYQIRESVTVADNEADMEEAMLGLAERRDVVIVTGGLGPTADDLTARAAARAFGRRLVLNDEALEQVRAFFTRVEREMHPRNEKQALLPQKVAILPNPIGTAPGFRLQHEERDFFFLPGVPKEMEAIFSASVLPRLRRRSRGDFPQQERILQVFGLSEPRVEEMLVEINLPEGVTVGFGVEFPLVRIKLRASGGSAETLLDKAELLARRKLGDFYVAAGHETLAGNVVQLLSNAGVTLSLAESCTGGMIAAMLTDFPGASSFLERGGVTYANSAKTGWLGVPQGLLDQEGAVSEACAKMMARGIRMASGCDLGLAVTGIAGPDGGTEEKPVGTVFIALAWEGGEKVKGYRFHGDRGEVRRVTALMGLEWLRRHLIDAGDA